jgi:hypothetical protein
MAEVKLTRAELEDIVKRLKRNEGAGRKLTKAQLADLRRFYKGEGRFYLKPAK